MLIPPRTPPTRPDEDAVIAGWLSRVSTERRHVVVSLSGAHAYGFPSPDSDLDLKAVHAAPTVELLGLGKPKPTADFLGIVDGLEVDYTSNELSGVLAGVLAGNGNYIERFLSGYALLADPALEELQPLVHGALNRRIHGHYLGFSTQLYRRLSQPGATVKHSLYVLRCALTGAHGLLTGQIETDLGRLAGPYGFGEATELIAAKRAGEKVALTGAALERAEALCQRALAALEDAHARSILPEEAPNKDALEAWLIDFRLRGVR